MKEVNQNLIVPVIVENWLKEVKSEKTTEFARSLYRDKLEYLARYILNELEHEKVFGRRY